MVKFLKLVRLNIFLFICTKICLFVLIGVNVQNGEILDFSSIEHFFVQFAPKYVYLY